MRLHALTTPFAVYLDLHSADFLDLRMQGMGFDRAMGVMKERFEKEKEKRDDDPRG